MTRFVADQYHFVNGIDVCGDIYDSVWFDKVDCPAGERCNIAQRILERAEEYGIEKKDIIVDPLCLTVSSDPQSALTTLAALKQLSLCGFKTSLGVSNVSFGLPEREKINTTFFAAALENGLNCAIMNPLSQGMMDVYYSYRVLHGLDTSCADYIAYSDSSDKKTAASAADSGNGMTLYNAVVKGLKESAMAQAAKLIADRDPMDLLNSEIIPALDEVGKRFEEKTMYLPQLLMSAEAASGAFEVIKSGMAKGEASEKGSVILATVKGDIHDIGKNIVKVLLESYGFKVYDLGRDVPPEAVLQAVNDTGCRLVGLSALMTTTVPAMAETIRLLHSKAPGVKVVVGGAVLNKEYAAEIDADQYCKDAMETVGYAQDFYS